MYIPYIKAFLLVFFAYGAVASAVPDKQGLQERDYGYYGAAPARTTKHVTPAKCSTKTITKTTTKYKKVTATSPPKTLFITFTKTLTVRVTAIVTLSFVSTSINTVTETAHPMPDLSCYNRLEYAVYRHSFTNDDVRSYPAFNVEYFKTAIPLFNETTPIVGIVGDSNTDSIYHAHVRGLDYTAVNHRGYLYAPQSGTYTFSAYPAHDITLLWVGATAFSGFTRENANIEQLIGGDPLTYDIFLTAGKYYPIRILWGNALGEAYLNFTVTAPNREVIVSSNKETLYFLTNSCDGTTAPAFAPFGQES
ncbi:hypothetical protein TWF481_000457 [Arthrobotrys musiformis]|uniref:PA14 domain-containing protein n=1 Tax=Arthrobotrys musiformis TaxID=47236 RepID=A0AAV9WML8_9PEZI